MCSNLPPGVTESMLPGNTPEDRFFEDVLDLLDFDPFDYNEGTEKRVTDMIWNAWTDGLTLAETVSSINNAILSHDEEE